MPATPRTIAAIEIGTATTKVVIARSEDHRINFVSLGTCLSQGIVAGTVVDRTAAADCIHAAIAAAERKAGVRIDRVYLAQSGAHLDSLYHEAAFEIDSADNRVRRTDIATVCERARAADLPPDRSVVQYLRRPFRLDDRIVLDPENMPGRVLKVGYSILHGDSPRIYAPLRLLNGLNILVEEIIPSGLASGRVVTSTEERRAGVLILDIGAGTTDYALYREGLADTVGVVSVGGDQLTNDLELGLRVTRKQAEQLKCRFARCAVTPTADDRLCWLEADPALVLLPVPRQAIGKIVSARVREIFELVRGRLQDPLGPASVGSGIILTGGTAKLPGIAGLAGAVFGLTAHVRAPSRRGTADLNDPTYSTVLGVFYHGLTARSAGPSTAAR